MAFLVWDDKYSVGVTELDNQHKQLITLIGDLYDAMSAQKANDIMGQILTKLINYTKTHFSTEERYMQQYSYPGLSDQKKEHAAFTEKVLKFKEDFDSGRTSMSVSVTSFLKDWLVNHICVSDKKYAPFMK